MPNEYQKRIYLPITRRHVTRGSAWAHELGTDYWFQPTQGFNQAAAASTATGDELAENGWVATGLENVGGSGADFISSADKGTPAHVKAETSGDLLESPAMFGDYWHARYAADLAGMKDLPNFLVARFLGALIVHSADEPRTGWGFIEDGGSVATEADQAAFISSDGTNFQISSNAGTPVNLQADDALWHEFVIVIRRSNSTAYAFIDPTWRFGTPPVGAALGSIAVTADEAPYSFGFHALTTNTLALGLTHVFYDW